MKTTTLMLLFAVLFFTQRLPAADVAKDWKVEVVGVRVVAVAPGSHDIEWALRGGAPGVTVILQITAPEGKIVGINADESKVDFFTDDQGTDLIAGHTQSSLMSETGISTWLGFNPPLGGKNPEFVKVTAPTQPAKGATQFNIQGKVVVQTASQTNQFTAKDVELKAGTKFSLGNLQWLVSNVRLRDGDYVVSLQTKQDLSGVLQVDFYDEEGNRIESTAGASDTRTSGAEKWGTLNFLLKKTSAKAKIAATCWTDIKTVEVPISVKAGIGL